MQPRGFDKRRADEKSGKIKGGTSVLILFNSIALFLSWMTAILPQQNKPSNQADQEHTNRSLDHAWPLGIRICEINAS